MRVCEAGIFKLTTVKKKKLLMQFVKLHICIKKLFLKWNPAMSNVLKSIRLVWVVVYKDKVPPLIQGKVADFPGNPPYALLMFPRLPCLLGLLLPESLHRKSNRFVS